MSAIEQPAQYSPLGIAMAIRQAWADFVMTGRSAPGKRHNVYASSYRACVRQMVLEMTSGDTLPPWPADTIANFRRGSDRERDLLADLKKIGRNAEPAFELVAEQERFELKDRKGRVAITGKVDCRLRFDNRRSAPLEVKSWNPNLTARVKRFEDLFDSRWTRSGAYQLLCYLFGAKEEFGFMLLDRPGIPLLLPVELYPNLDRLEDFLTKAEEAMDHREANTLPDFIDEPSECRYCHFFGAVCNPPLMHGPGADVLTDPGFMHDLERWYDLKPSAKEFKQLDEEIKERLRGTLMAIAGPFAISGKWGKSTSYNVPAEIAEKYKTVDPQGRFTVTITRTEERDVQF